MSPDDLYCGGLNRTHPCPFALTAADGSYTVTGLNSTTSGSVTFSKLGYTTQRVSPVNLVAGQTTTVNAQLQPAPPQSATLEGDVSTFVNSVPQGVAGATIIVHNYFGFVVATTTSGSDRFGEWTVSGLPAGVYRVEFQPPAGSNLLGQWYENQPDGAHSDTISLANGQTVNSIDATLAPGSGISGTVTDAQGPVPGAAVSVLIDPLNGQPDIPVAHTVTTADGSYSFSGLLYSNFVSYQVLFDPPAGSADVGQWYSGSGSQPGASIIDVNAGQTTTGIDAHLTTGQRGSIRGTATDRSGHPIAGVTVEAIRGDGTTTTATSAADGTYTIANLDVGIYTVWFVPPTGSNYRASVWNAAAGKIVPLTVDQGSTIPGIDAKLSQNGTVTGTVTGPSGPIAGAMVTVANYYGIVETTATTAANGGYTVAGLQPGSTRVEFAASGFVTQWWNNQPDLAHSNAINVPNNGSATANAMLTPSG